MKKLGLKLLVFFLSNSINCLSLLNPKRATNIALRLFSRPRKGRPNKKQASYLKKHIKGYITIDSKQICYYHWKGTGDSILMVHGWESNSSRWKPYISDLVERNYNIYALDAPAHGLSEGKYFSPEIYANAVGELIEKYNILVLLGHSIGAYVCILHASGENNHPSLKHLILMAPTGKLRIFMNRFFDFLKLNSIVRERYAEDFINTYNRDLDYYDSDNLIKKIELDGLLIHDKNDRTLDFEESLLIAQNWSKGKFVATEGYGHRLKSSEVNNIIFNYLDSL